jgi:hypothetical protein
MATQSQNANISLLADPVRDFAKSIIDQNPNVSAAHNFKHATRVGEGAKQLVTGVITAAERDTESTKILKVVGAAGGAERLAEVARAGGYLHDIVRAPTEAVKAGTMDDEQASVEKSRPKLTELLSSGILTASEMNAILASIRTATVTDKNNPLLPPEEKDRMSYLFEDTSRLIRFAVFAADKNDANGFFVIARRSQFVGGERLTKPDGDLYGIKQQLDRSGNPFAKQFDPELVVALESYIRLGVKNNPEVYPTWYRPVVDPLFGQQLGFYFPLLAHRGLREGDLARLLVELKFPGIKPADIEKWEAKRNTEASNERINAVTAEQAESAYYTLNFYSAPNTVDTDTEALIRSEPSNSKLPTAQKWHSGMLSYLDNGIDYPALLLRR